MSRLMLAVLAAIVAASIMPAVAGAHSLVRVYGSELTYVSADATSLNSLTVSASATEIALRDPTVDGGIDPGPCRPGEVTPDASAYIIEAFCDRADLTRVRVDLGEREDSATVAVPLPVTLLGGPGADRLTAGPAPDTVAGGEGNDRLSGAGGADVLDGGEGADAFDGGEGDDRLRSADGLAETVACGDGSDSVEADTSDDVASDCESVVRSAVAPPSDAILTGADTRAPVVRAGASTLQTLTRSEGGSDHLEGATGDDRLIGSTGDDALIGGDGVDRLSGNAGNDRLGGGSKRDILAGGAGVDTLSGDSGNDAISGGPGNDRISGGSAADRIYGNAGSDRITPGRGKDRVIAAGGNDRISARDGRKDRISCGSGRDTVTADRNDVLTSCERVTRR